MENIMNVDPGLLIWTLVNFIIFVFILYKIGLKPMKESIQAREQGIRSSIEQAEKANAEAQALLKQSQEKIAGAQTEVSEILKKGQLQAEENLRNILNQAEKAKQQKVEDATREIERSKEAALKELRLQAAAIVIEATEKIIGEKLDKEKDLKLVESYIDKIQKN